MADASKSSKSLFENIVDEADEVDNRRRALERNMFKVVLILSALGLASAGINSSSLISIVSWYSPSGGHNATIYFAVAVSGNNLTLNSTQLYPTFNNTFVRFNVSFSDVDLNDWHTMFVCNESGTNYTLTSNGVIFNYACPGRRQFCNYSNKIMVTDNPMYCDYHVYGYKNQTQNFSMFLIDSGNKVVHINGTFAVDRPPKITGISILRTG